VNPEPEQWLDPSYGQRSRLPAVEGVGLAARVNTLLAYVNAMFMGIGANVWGKGTLIAAVVFTALIVPVFALRHYVQDKGKFPDHMYEELGIKPGEMATLPKPESTDHPLQAGLTCPGRLPPASC